MVFSSCVQGPVWVTEVSVLCILSPDSRIWIFLVGLHSGALVILPKALTGVISL